MRDGVVAIDGGRITYAGAAAKAPRSEEAATRVKVVMPGMWDCHIHFMGMRDLHLERLPGLAPQTLAGRATRDVTAVLNAGFTSVREVGGLGIFLQPVIEEGTLAGPTIYGAGSILSQTGGHADIHSASIATVADFSAHGGMLQLCDGVAECLRAVRLQLRKGARVIKICASGGVLSEVDHPIHQQFSDDELRAIVDEAGRADRVVAAHCHGKPGIMAALRAGCRTIEHGSYLDEEAAAAMRDAKAILVWTRSIVASLMAGLDRIPAYGAAKARMVSDRHLEAMAHARKAGVTLAAGTDFGTSGAGTLAPHGANGGELVHLVEAGLTPLEAIEAATANGPLTLGPQGPRAGILAEGYDADVIALDADPLADISVLADPAHVTHVWKAGRLVKGAA